MPSQPPMKPSTQPTSRRERRELERAQTPRVRARASASQRPPAWRSPMALVSAAAVAVIVLVIVLTQKPGGSAAGELIAPPLNAAVTAGLVDGEALGKADAPVTLEIWSDFQCPICGSLAKDYMPRLHTDFVIAGQIRIVPHDIAIVGVTADNESLAAAVGARCAGAQGKYWEFHDWLFWNQSGENKGAFSADRLKLIADKVGVDRTAWDACIADSAQATAVRVTTSQSSTLGISSTPTFKFAGQTLTGLPRAYADLASAIRKVLPSAAPSGRTAAPSATGPAASPAASK